MNKFKMVGLFTLFAVWGLALFITMDNNKEEVSKDNNSKSIIIIDNKKQLAYTEYTDELELTYSLNQSQKLAIESKRLIEEKKAKEAKEKKIAYDKKLAEEKKIAEAKRKAEVKRIASEKAKKAKLARIAEKKRQVALAKEAEKKKVAQAEATRIANLEVKRDANRKAKAESKKNGTEKVVVSRGNTSNASEAYYEITAYTAGVESTGKRKGDKNYGLTASGNMVQNGVSLACPRSIPFGTKIEIEGYGTRVCVDRGGHITNGRLDIYMDSPSAAQQFGRRTIKVKIYK